jgi:hypothetical protein
MELENNNTTQTYAQLLVDTLKRKSEVLLQLMELTSRQENVISSEPFNEDQFMDIMDLKEEKIQVLNRLDEGFDKIYQSIRMELQQNKEQYSSDINIMKEFIIKITDLSINLQTMELRNKSKIEIIFGKKRREIRESTISSKTVANYYKSMSSQQEGQSFFYDKKK